MTLTGRTVYVGADGNVDKALRKFKRKIQTSGVLMDLREKEFYTKPTTRKKIKAAQARNRWQKYIKDQELPTRKF